MDGKSLDIVNDKLERLKSLLPEAFSEGKLDIEKLRLSLGEDVSIQNERYVLNWAGKGDAFKALQSPTTATLAPAEDESINFDKTENIFIEGENLEVLKVLQKAYYGKVKMIYIDPPYNTGNDSFVYPDRFAESREQYLKRINDKDEQGYLMKEGLFRKNNKDSGHYHSNWLSMMYPRLFLAKNLLKDDGVIFVSIDDNEVHNLRLLLNDIFGEENFLGSITIVSNLKGRSDDKYYAAAHNYLLIYTKGSFVSLGVPIPPEYLESYRETDKKGRKFRLQGLRKRGAGAKREDRPNMFFPIYVDARNGRVSLVKTPHFSEEVYPKLSDGSDGRWRWGKITVEERNDELVGKTVGSEKRWDVFQIDYAEDEEGKKRIKPKTVWTGSEFSNEAGTLEVKELMGKGVFDNPKPIGLIKYCIEHALDDDDIVLDFFAGSATTAHAVFEMNMEDRGNRKFICVQLPEVTDNNSVAYIAGYKTIADIAKERIRRVINMFKNENPMFAENGQDLGFKIFKLKHSNFKLWRGDGIENQEILEKQLDILADPVRPEALEEHMLFELLLKSGYPLTTQVEKREVGKAHYYLVDGELAIALSHLDEATITDMLERKPQQMICLDSLFGNNDPLKTNTQLQFKDAGITFHSI